MEYFKTVDIRYRCYVFGRTHIISIGFVYVAYKIVEAMGKSLQKLEFKEDTDVPYKPADMVEAIMPSIQQLLILLLLVFLVGILIYLQSGDVSKETPSENEWETLYSSTDSDAMGDTDGDYFYDKEL